MSSTRGINSPKRRAYDFYETPDWAVEAILPVLDPWVDPEYIFEPGAGSGAITRVVRDRWPTAWYTAVEIDPSHHEVLSGLVDDVSIEDYLDPDGRDWPHYDLIIMNPPYSGPKRQDLVMGFTIRAISHVRHGVVAVLTRLNWLGSQKRAFWHREQQPFVGILPNKTDSVEYCWLVYGIPELRGRWQVLEMP